MKIPEPIGSIQVLPQAEGAYPVTRVVWYKKTSESAGNIYSEDQLREALAQQDRDTADGFSIAHLQGHDQAKRKFEAVMRQALEALKIYEKGFRSPYTAPAIKALEEALK